VPFGQDIDPPLGQARFTSAWLIPFIVRCTRMPFAALRGFEEQRDQRSGVTTVNWMFETPVTSRTVEP
jgi:hypothetical protein